MKSYYPVGISVSYTCHQAYNSVPGLDPVITCLQNLTWSSAPEFCTAKSCGNPGKPENCRVVILTNLLFGARVNFICEEGYRLNGSSSTRCSFSRNQVQWTRKPPVCQQILCPAPPSITNGMHVGGSIGHVTYIYNSTVIYTCDHGFSICGNASIHCTSQNKRDGVWSEPVPECKGKHCLWLSFLFFFFHF
uniref:Sushi domain-containing protein n=1 Tax=Sphenodon punctatus TaxID=8508 RepID=A0A8D0L7M5_SPHPU